MNPTYPLYVISKNRWDSRLTSKALEKMKVPYHIVIEPQEYKDYSSVIQPDKILTLPFSNLGQGSIPARNWVWEHSLSTGAERHWILDDNIDGFVRLNRNEKIKVVTGTIFRCAEDFVDRYENVGLAGFHYDFFCKGNQRLPAFYVNTRIYSCILVRNNLPFRWRGRYNEDTDLSLRVLKMGECTLLFAAFLACKARTMTMKGGNTDELYQDDGRLKMAESLVEQHPDCSRIYRNFGRFQHYVDYKRFKKNTLKRKPNLNLQNRVNDYGMILKTTEES
jgi:hypothetical protein